MKKSIVFVLLLVSVVMIAAGLSACTASFPEGEVHIVAVNFAGYDFAAEIVGRDNDRVSLEFLSGGDAHSFNPSFNDVAKIQNADLFIYVGGESDTAVETLLSGVRDVNTFKMIDCVELLEEEEEEASHGDGEDHDHGAYDEHVWTSPANAITIVEALCDAICEIDPDYAEDYRSHADAYKASLAALDEDFKALFAACDSPTLVFGDRFPLLYFAKHYAVSYYAAFPGCSSASEPSPKTVASLIEIVKNEGISTVFYIESGTHEVAYRIAEESGAQTALFHSCHKVTADEIASGVTYLSLMRDNYKALEKALKPV